MLYPLSYGRFREFPRGRRAHGHPLAVYPNGTGRQGQRGASHSPVHTGRRFCRKARIPSWASRRVALSVITSVARS